MRTHSNNALSSTALTANIFLAQIDVGGLIDYAVTASVCGAIWLGYKIVADRIGQYRKARVKNKQSREPPIEPALVNRPKIIHSTQFKTREDNYQPKGLKQRRQSLGKPN